MLQKLTVDQSHSKPLAIIADLEDEQATEQMLKTTLEHFDQKLNLLVNNAGLGLPIPHTLPVDCYKAYKRTMQVNLNSIVYLTTMAASALKKAAKESEETSSVIMIGSIAAFRPSETLAAYSVAKAGLNAYTESMAVELAPWVRVNCISPGPIETKIIERAGFPLDEFRKICSKNSPLGRIGLPDEVAEVAAYFADHKRSGYVTGANMTIDGGRVLSPMKWTE